MIPISSEVRKIVYSGTRSRLMKGSPCSPRTSLSAACSSPTLLLGGGRRRPLSPGPDGHGQRERAEVVADHVGRPPAAGALGLLVGIGVPLIGTTTAGISMAAAVIGTAGQLASSCSSSVPSSPTCAHATTRSPLRPCSSCWPWPRWCWGWPPEPALTKRASGRSSPAICQAGQPLPPHPLHLRRRPPFALMTAQRWPGPRPGQPTPARRAMKTSSRPGRSAAWRTSSTT